MGLTYKQKRFIDEYLVDLNGAQAAIRAGYSKNAAKEQASRLLTNANIRTVLKERFQETEYRLQITRDDILRGLLSAAQMGKELGDPIAMISACKEIGRMLGYYEKPSKTQSSDQCSLEFLEQLKQLSDEELAAIIQCEELPA